MQHDPRSFVIVATYGNAWPHQRWASNIRNRDDAEKLRRGAIKKGFTDATIWVEKDFQAFLAEKERSRADARSDDRRRRWV